ncbi:MAG: hypothetical protein AB7I38_01390 [Dehalococcoidia bacterium]
MNKGALGLLALAGLVVCWLAINTGGPLGGTRAEACAFLRTPSSYEADERRMSYALAMDAAAVNALFPGDDYFGLPALKVGPRSNRIDGAARMPATLLRAIGWVESNTAMAARSVSYESVGPALVSFDCGYGIMQVTSGMTAPLGSDNQPTTNQARVAAHYLYNIARGAAILAAKWNEAPASRPIAGVDTNSDPSIVENWYYAVWGYNGFTGPGAVQSNHPLDPRFSASRERWKCDGTQSRTRYPYQEVVWGCMASPPTRAGQQLWTSVAASLPNLSDPRFAGPLSPSNFTAPFSSMDIPTAQPSHTQPAPTIPGDFPSRVLGSPVLSVSDTSIELGLDGGGGAAKATVTVENSGSGILVWTANPSANWIVIDPPAGVALGPEVVCGPGCSRSATFTVTLNPAALPQAMTSGSITIGAANGTSEPVVVTINAEADFELPAPGTSRAY